MQNHVGFRAIFQPENEGHRRKIIYRDKEDGKTNILVISEFWKHYFCNADFCKPFLFHLINEKKDLLQVKKPTPNLDDFCHSQAKSKLKV